MTTKKEDGANNRAKVAQSLYEAWMDGKESAANDVLPPETPTKVVTRNRKSKYAYSDAYRQSVSLSPSLKSLNSIADDVSLRLPKTPVGKKLARNGKQPISRKRLTTSGVLNSSDPTPLPTVEVPKVTRQPSPKPPPPKPPVNIQRPPRASSAQKLPEDNVEFQLFYAWVSNGRESDIDEETIKALLFKQGKAKILTKRK